MTTITFTVDGTEHSVDVAPVHGDPNALFREAPDRVAAAVADLGLTFTAGAAPTYQELSRAARASGDGIALGDLSDRVEPIESKPAADEDGIVLEVVGPDGASVTQAFTADQNLGAVAAAVGDELGVGVMERVVLYLSSDRADPLGNDTAVDAVSPPLYWEVTAVADA